MWRPFAKSKVYSGGNSSDPWVELGSKNQRISTDYGFFWASECWHPRRQAVLSTAFHVSFAFITAFIIFSVFIGAVTGGMSDAIDEFAANNEAEDMRTEMRIAHREDPKSVGVVGWLVGCFGWVVGWLERGGGADGFMFMQHN
jgi:hypothetical protein